MTSHIHRGLATGDDAFKAPRAKIKRTLTRVKVGNCRWEMTHLCVLREKIKLPLRMASLFSKQWQHATQAAAWTSPSSVLEAVLVVVWQKQRPEELANTRRPCERWLKRSWQRAAKSSTVSLRLRSATSEQFAGCEQQAQRRRGVEDSSKNVTFL